MLLEGVDADPRLAIPYTLSCLPVIPASEMEIQEAREEAMLMVNTIIRELQAGVLVIKPMAGPNAMMIETGYSLTYHGGNNELFRRRIGLMHGLGYPFLASVSSRLGLPVGPGRVSAAERSRIVAEAEKGYRGAVRVPPALSAK